MTKLLVQNLIALSVGKNKFLSFIHKQGFENICVDEFSFYFFLCLTSCKNSAVAGN